MPITRVLIVDDNAKFIKSVKNVLSYEQDIEVIGRAKDGREALSMAQALQPEIILMDVRMPGMGGIEATQRINRIMPKTKIIILTLYDMDEYRDAATKVGAAGYVLKKYMRKQLIPKIKEISEIKVPNIR